MHSKITQSSLLQHLPVDLRIVSLESAMLLASNEEIVE